MKVYLHWCFLTGSATGFTARLMGIYRRENLRLVRYEVDYIDNDPYIVRSKCFYSLTPKQLIENTDALPWQSMGIEKFTKLEDVLKLLTAESPFPRERSETPYTNPYRFRWDKLPPVISEKEFRKMELKHDIETDPDYNLHYMWEDRYKECK